MLVIAVLAFLSIFIVVALVLFASSSGSAERKRQTMVNLDSALATHRSAAREQVLNLRKDEALSAVPWLNRWLGNLQLASKLRILLYQADLKWTTGTLILLSISSFVAVAFLVNLRTDTRIFAVLLGLLAGFLPLVYVLNKRRQRFARFEQRLPEALDLMVSALRAGHSLVAALRLVATESPEPLQSEFRTCYDEQNYGLELRTAMDNLVTRVPLQDLKIAVTAILIQKESGGNLAEVLEKTAYVIRERFRLKRQVRTHTAQGRLTGWILSFLPIVLGIALYIINPTTMSVLWTNPIGVKLLYAAAIMMIIGALIIRKIVNMEV